jgi:hypothetical protein
MLAAGFFVHDRLRVVMTVRPRDDLVSRTTP